MASALQRLSDMLGFLATLRQFTADQDSIDMQRRLLQGCLVDIRQSPGFAPAEGTQMLEKVQTALLPDWMQTDISKCIQEMVMSLVQDAPAGTKRKRVCTQRNLHIYNYFTAGEWETLKSQRHTIGKMVFDEQTVRFAGFDISFGAYLCHVRCG